MSDETPKTFDMVAYTGGKLHVDGFDDPVVVDLNGLEASGEIPIAIKHDTGDETIIGQTDPDKIENDGEQLKLGCIVTADPAESPRVKRILGMAKRGHKWQASIGARIEESRDIPAGETVHVNGQEIEGPIVLATKSVLRETSVLAMGADKHTSVTFAAGAVLNFKAESTEMADETSITTDQDGFEAWVKDTLELDPGTLNEEAKNALMQQYAAATADKNDEVDAEDKTEKPDEPAEEGDEPATEEPPADKKKGKVMAAAKKIPGTDGASTNNLIAQRRKDLAAEDRRIESIRAVCGKDLKLCAAAVEKGWSAEKAELEFLKRQDRNRAPAGHVKTSTPEGTLQALQGAMILRAKGKLDHPGFSGELGLALELPSWLRAGINTSQRQKAMEASWQYRDLSLIDLCKMAVAIDGGESKFLNGSRSGFIRAAVSGGSLPDIFTTNINALLIEKLIEHGDSTIGWTSESDAMNFQPMERTRLTKAGGLTPHGRGGKADEMTRSDIMETYKIGRFSKQFKVDEMDIIDDRFQAFQDIPDEMAKGAARLRPDLVYSILFANANLGATSQALLSATQPGSQSNLVASGGTLSSTTLQNGMATMFNQQENGVNVGASPTHILVPMVLAGTAFNLLQGQNIALAGVSGTVTQLGDVNPLKSLQEKFGRVEVVSDPRLTNGVIDPKTGTSYSGSLTTWRLASNKVKTIEVAYLRGSGRAPQVRQFILDRGEWGMGWDVNLDIGAKALEWRGFYESRA